MVTQNAEILRRLKSTHYLDNIGLLFKSLYSNENLADVTISCRDGPTIEAHKIVLSACSSYFHELLSQKTSHPVFIMHKVSYQEMLYLLEFMYKGVIDVPEDNVDKLIKIAKELEITDFCLPENTEPNLEVSEKMVNHKKRKLIQIENADVIDLRKSTERNINDYSTINKQEIRNSISERSNSDTNENQPTSLARNTRFKGKKRVPVGELEIIDAIELSPPRSGPKKKIITPKKNVAHSTPNANDGISNFIIKDISGANGSIVLSYADKKNTIMKPRVQITGTEPNAQEIDILDVTPDITIANNQDSEDDSVLLDDPNDEPEPNSTGSSPDTKSTIDLKRRFKCDMCKKRFLRGTQLSRHKKIHHAGGSIRVLFPCKKCDEKFSRIDKLKLHEQNYHDDDDYVPKGEKKKKLYGNPMEASPNELKQIEFNNNPSSVTQSIIQSIKDISSENNHTANNNESTLNGKRRRGRPRKDKTQILKTPGPIGRPKKYFGSTRPEGRKPIGRPRKTDTPVKIKVFGRKRGRPRKTEVYSIDGNKPAESIKSEENYDGASLPYGDLSYLTSGFITPQEGATSTDNSLMYTTVDEEKATTPPKLSPAPEPLESKNDLKLPLDEMVRIPPINTKCNTTITPINTPPPPTLAPIIPFKNENITITQIPPLIYIKPSSSPTTDAPTAPSETTSSASGKPGNNMSGDVKIGECTIRPIT